MIDHRSPNFDSTPVSLDRPMYPYICDNANRDETCPAVSVVTPFYNTGPVFLETAKCVLGQSLQNIEWIVVDDGSTNAQSIAMLSEVAASDPRVIVVRLEKNVGPGGGRNAGIKSARAPYIFQLDADDLIEPTALEKCAWYLADNPHIAFVKGWTVGFSHNPHLWTRGFHDCSHFLQENVSTITAMIRRDVFLAVGGYDETILGGMEDWDLWIRCAANGKWGTTIPEYLDWYRRRPNHADVWEDWDGAERQRKFTSRLREKYKQLTSDNFPKVAPQPSFPLEDIPRSSHIVNKLKPGSRRLLVVVPWLTMGGADKFNIRMIEQLRARGWEVTVAATLAGDQGWLPQFTELTPDVFVMPHFLRQATRPAFLRYLIESRGVSHVLMTNSEMAYLVLPYLRSACPDVTYVDYCHMEEEYWKHGGYPRYAAYCQEQLDLNIVSSHHLQSWMVNRGADRSRIEVCSTNEDTSEWKPDVSAREHIRSELNIPANTATLLYAGRICEQKQPRVFAQTVLELHKRNADFVVIVAGDGVDKPMLEEFSNRHGLGKHLRFLGAVPNAKMKPLMAASDIFFLPSLWEGISLAIYEAMASGLVIIGGDVGGQRELVTAECGRLISRSTPEKETQQYADALMPLVADPALARAMGAKARQRIIDHYQLHHMGERMNDLLMLADQHKRTNPRPRVPSGLAYELAVRAVEYLRLHDLADALWGERERLARMVGGSVNMQVAPPPSVGAPGANLAAELELAHIENSRFFGVVRSFKDNAIYRVIARMRWGQAWDRVDPNEPAPQRLARIKASRSYKMVQRMKASGLYRLYALRKYGSMPTQTEGSHTSGVSSVSDRA